MNQKRHKHRLILKTLIAVIMVTHIMSTPVALAEGDLNKRIEVFEGVATMPTQSENEARKEANLRAWIDKLAMKESGNNADTVVFDTNSKYSRGCLQFQDETFTVYSKLYSINTDIMDCAGQKELAYRMIKDNYNNWSHWQCSVIGCSKYNITGIGKPPVI